MLNFTRQERVIIYFLIISLGIGAILKLVKEQKLEDEIKPTRFYKEKQQFTETADKLNSGQVTIDSLETNMYADDAEAKSDSIKIDINRAGVEELSKLPGVGPVIAGRIKAYVENNGPFKEKDEIKLVKGIGNKTYSGIQDLVTIE